MAMADVAECDIVFAMDDERERKAGEEGGSSTDGQEETTAKAFGVPVFRRLAKRGRMEGMRV